MNYTLLRTLPIFPTTESKSHRYIINVNDVTKMLSVELPIKVRKLNRQYLLIVSYFFIRLLLYIRRRCNGGQQRLLSRQGLG